MPLLRTQYAGRLQPAMVQVSQRRTPFYVRYASTDADRSIEPAPKAQSSDPPAAQAGDSDWHTPVDHGTSQFSPIPRRVMDGSESGGSVAAAVLSGAPVELQARTVRIYRPAKTATQSGGWNGHHWRMDWDILHKGYRWENPMMGWQSSADFMQGTHLNFKSREDAILFAEKQGYEYFVQEPNERKFVPKAYANNFMHYPKKLKIIRTK
ncbi:nadh-ubiquinone oxidoreductase 18 kda [Lasallia pustulata]|uniref:NADH dehydrogenase [ubiquinone] iron-sulfur protein 4, mitochondrial n=1 Tax=Lasallia pustulata TaxID=136370 RepID=A0A1W5D046_9LECA|nr:nadh-ubiquinone oxidoreductase 18 kda [Lasallia pustulata]